MREYEGESREPYSSRMWPDRKDNITAFLKANCICLKSGRAGLSGKFLWNENGTQVHIQSRFTNYFGEKVKRYVHLEVMPESAELPKDLATFLQEESFEKQEGRQ